MGYEESKKGCLASMAGVICIAVVRCIFVVVLAFKMNALADKFLEAAKTNMPETAEWDSEIETGVPSVGNAFLEMVLICILPAIVCNYAYTDDTDKMRRCWITSSIFSGLCGCFSIPACISLFALVAITSGAIWHLKPECGHMSTACPLSGTNEQVVDCLAASTWYGEYNRVTDYGQPFTEDYGCPAIWLRCYKQLPPPDMVTTATEQGMCDDYQVKAGCCTPLGDIAERWVTTATGGGSWVTTDESIRFNIANSQRCNGTALEVQQGEATLELDIKMPIVVNVSMTGMAEAAYEKFELYQDDELIVKVTAQNDGVCQEGTCIMCPVSMPPVTVTINPGSKLRIVADTQDPFFHNGAFFEVDFEAIRDECDSCFCKDQMLPWPTTSPPSSSGPTEAETTCPEYYPVCSADFDCVIDDCTDGLTALCGNGWMYSEDPTRQRMDADGTMYNRLHGYDGQGSPCSGSFAAEQAGNTNASEDAAVTAQEARRMVSVEEEHPWAFRVLSLAESVTGTRVSHVLKHKNMIDDVASHADSHSHSGPAKPLRTKPLRSLQDEGSTTQSDAAETTAASHAPAPTSVQDADVVAREGQEDDAKEGFGEGEWLWKEMSAVTLREEQPDDVLLHCKVNYEIIWILAVKEEFLVLVAVVKQLIVGNIIFCLLFCFAFGAGAVFGKKMCDEKGGYVAPNCDPPPPPC
jgi:hypothetical protein